MNLLLTIVFGLMRGIQEGMIMAPGGVRSHMLFDTYHLSSVILIILAVMLCINVIQRFPGWIYLFGLLILLWEFTEIGYSLSRWYVPIYPYEHIVVLDFFSATLTGLSVYAIHILRAVAAVILLILGSVKGGDNGMG